MDVDKSTENTGQTNAVIRTSIISSIFTLLIILGALILWLQPLNRIEQNKLASQNNQKQLELIKESVEISRAELELQIKDYISKNYGVLSERDEQVDKLLIYFRQQDARLNNIEKALSKF